MIGKQDPGTTGAFEVTLVETNQLLHSKLTRGQGRCETASQVQAVVDQIQSYLDKSSAKTAAAPAKK